MVEYRTTDTNELAPYPDMTGDDLKDFEVWAREIEKQGSETLRTFAWVFVAVILVFTMLYIA